MKLPILSTKLYMPQLPSKTVLRTHLNEQLDNGSKCKLTLISASAGFGKTTLLSQWAEYYDYPVGWISLDDEHSDVMRFLLYLLGAIQSVKIDIDESISHMILSPQPPSYLTILTLIINELTNLEDDFSLILDDYHLIESKEVDDSVIFLIDNMPSQMHIIISTRVDPRLPLARLRAQGQMVEIRVSDMRFRQSEITEYMNRIMELGLIKNNISALEMRTEGWIAGLKLAAISMQDSNDINGFIESFTGSNRYIIDYLLEEVFNKLSKNVQEFLLRTSVLDRMCGALCDELYPGNSISGQETLEYLDKINMFVIPLDTERHWYRYHHLFAQILRQKMSSSDIIVDESEYTNIEDLHLLASSWFEKNNLYVEAFKYAAKTRNIEHAQRLVKGNGIPLQYLGALVPILNWLESLGKDTLDAHPSLWVTYASTLCIASKFDAVEDKLTAAEASLKGKELDDFVRNLIGHIASTRAFLAITKRDTQLALSQSKIALKNLQPDNVVIRTSSKWVLGMAYHAQGNIDAARTTLEETIAICNATGNFVVGVSAASVLGKIYEEKNELHLAAKTYENVIKAQRNMSLITSAYFSHMGLARIFYEWNDVEKSLEHCMKGVELSQQLADTDIIIDCQIFLARIKIYYKDYIEAKTILDRVYETIQLNNFENRIYDLAIVQVILMIKQGNLNNAYKTAKELSIPVCEARVYIEEDRGVKAIEALELLLIDVEEAGREDKKLEVLILLSIAYKISGNAEEAKKILQKALKHSELNGFIRSYIDEGEKVIDIITKISDDGKISEYISKIIEAFKADKIERKEVTLLSSPQTIIEDLSNREIEVLQLIAQGLSNREICEKLFLAIDTVKGHNRRIYGKLGVNNRTSAIKRANALGIISI